MSKLWEKNTTVDQRIDLFTVGKDRELDSQLAKYDILGSLAHIKMLQAARLLTEEEYIVLAEELRATLRLVEDQKFIIEEGVEDIHSQVELLLTKKLGDIGKKIHSGRSRNDQVLVDLKLFTRAEIEKVTNAIDALFVTLINQSNQHKNTLMPGYTHLQIAMPSSFGLWFGAYAESLADDLQLLLSAWKITNRNPLGSAAGYGSSFPLDRQLTSDLLGFDSMNFNVVYAQMGRGKMEKTVANALASVAATLSKLAFDICLYNSQNFGFIKLPDKYTTGSSIMPHKKNPDVFELIRAKCNKIETTPQQLLLITNNLPSGYFRDYQILKEIFLPIFAELTDCLTIANMMIEQIEINKDILSNPLYDYIFSVEEVNRLVLAGTPFRDAYKEVGMAIENDNFHPNREIHHTHQGSLGNLCNEEIMNYKNNILALFNFSKVNTALNNLSAN